MTKADKTRVFLSYAHEDLDMVRRIYTGLKERNLDVWFDKEDLGPGRWMRKIEKAIPKSRFFVICISEAALKKTGDEPGFQDEELQQAYEIARVQPEDAFTIVPIRLEDCGRGDHRLSSWQQYNLFNDFEAELNHLAVDLGGVSFTDRLAEDTRTEKEKNIARLAGTAEVLYYAGDFRKAADIFTSITYLNPDYAHLWLNKGLSLYALGRQDEAIAAYNKALEIQPDYTKAWFNKGNVHSDLGQQDEAMAAYDKALEIQPDYTKAWNSKGIALSGLGQKDEAIAAFDKALVIKPDYADAWNNKGALSLCS
jgi:tetratricopeptide (TPR) repeat protein